MRNFKNIWKITLVVCLLCCLCLVCAACGGKDGGEGEGTEPTTSARTTTYTINISSVTGASMRNVSVYVYTNATCKDLVTTVTADQNGTVTFDAAISNKYVAVLMGVPAGYQVEAYYPLASILTDIVLEPGVITNEEKPANKIYALGDIVYDFTITDCNGISYKLSELLEEKDAVVLNFWYINCAPCKMEFPFLEQAYKEYSDEIEVLGINCEDGNDAELKNFAKDFELTFPLAIGEKSYWLQTAYPTTIVIDRYGTIVYMHTGYFDEVAPFNALFRIVTEDDYQQTLIKNVEDVITEDDYRPDGSKERPFELGGMVQFEVKTQGSDLVHYNLYRLSNQTMRIENPDAYVVIDGEYYYPDSNGVIELVVSSPDTFSPLKVAFGHTGNGKNTIQVKFIFEAGNVNNPVRLNHGDVSVSIRDLNGLGVYYYYDAAATGTLTLTVRGCTDGATPDIHLYNVNTSESVYLASDGVTDPETGLTSISITVNEGDHLQIIFSASTDPESHLFGATIQALASFMEDGGTGVIDGKQEYTVTVLDQNGNPVPGVVVQMTSDGQNTNLTTNEEGKIIVRLIEGAYFLEMTTPGGYVSEANSFLWSPAVKNLNVTLHTTSFHTVKLQTQYGLVLPNVQVRVYSDAELKDLMYVITSDANGMIKFLAKTDETFFLTLSNVDSSVQVQPSYTTNGENTVLALTQTGVATNVVLGDEMPNFAVTDVDGQYHVLQDLLKEKKMVIVTFWRTDCDASIRVLNNLQMLQEHYGEEIAILALNPVDTLEMDLQMYQSLYGLTIPLAKCPEALAQALGVTELPTTVVIDREGKLCLIHTGEFTEEQGTAMVEFYTTESYVHTTFLSLEELMNQNGTTEDEEELEP